MAVALVGKEIQSAADVKVTDAAGVGEVETFVERIAYTAEKAVAQQGLYRIFVLFPERFVTPLVIAVVGVVIDSYIGTETGLRGQSRPCGAYVDDAVQGRRTIEHAGGSFDDLYLLHIFQRYAVPVDDSVLGAEHAHPVYQYQAAGTYAVSPAATASNAGLLVDDIHPRNGLQCRGDVCGSLAGNVTGLYQIHGDRHIAQLLFKPSGRDHDIFQQVGAFLHVHVFLHNVSFADDDGHWHILISHIAEYQIYTSRRQVYFVCTVYVGHYALRVFQLVGDRCPCKRFIGRCIIYVPLQYLCRYGKAEQ